MSAIFFAPVSIISKNNLVTLFQEKEKQKEATEPKHIIVEIEDERIKSQLIASAMKKASSSKNKKANKDQNVVILKASEALKAAAKAAAASTSSHSVKKGMKHICHEITFTFKKIVY